MFSRPGTEDTESDLLRFQEEFLAGRLNPSATVVRSNNEGESRPLSAGGKRVSPSAPEIERDVVTLEGNRCLIAYILSLLISEEKINRKQPTKLHRSLFPSPRGKLQFNL